MTSTCTTWHAVCGKFHRGALEHGPEAIATLAAMLNDPAAPHMAKIIAANSLLDRGWGRPPQAVEVYNSETPPDEREESAREVFVSRLIELGARLRAEEDPRKLN